MIPHLFYSNRCPNSQKLIKFIRPHEQALKNLNLKAHCIDNGGVQMPPNIRVVPAVVVIYPPPKSAETHQGNGAFQWFKDMLNPSNSDQMSGSAGNLKAPSGTPMSSGGAGLGGLMPYDRDTNGRSWSSNFSSIADKSIEMPTDRFEQYQNQGAASTPPIPPPMNARNTPNPNNQMMMQQQQQQAQNLMPPPQHSQPQHSQPQQPQQGGLNYPDIPIPNHQQLNPVAFQTRPESVENNKPNADEMKRRMDELQKERQTIAPGPQMSFGRPNFADSPPSFQ